jgi:hypothetical protein
VDAGPPFVACCMLRVAVSGSVSVRALSLVKLLTIFRQGDQLLR